MRASASLQAFSRVALVVPCFNEAGRLPVAKFNRFLNESAALLIFVDDGSTDRTFELLQGVRAGQEDRVVVLKSARNQGKAEAVRYGISFALDQPVDYVGYWDADLATPLNAVAHFLGIFAERQDLDLVIGSRIKLLGRQVERRPLRHYLGRAFATVVSLMLQLPVYDTQCGAKILRVRPGTRDLFAAPFLSRWVFDVELLARYIRQVGSLPAAARRIYEYPLHAWQDVAGSKVKPSDFILAFCDLVRIYRRYIWTWNSPERLVNADNHD
jgi:dolichyl-phosphate beta-glucosyltransferase